MDISAQAGKTAPIKSRQGADAFDSTVTELSQIPNGHRRSVAIQTNVGTSDRFDCCIPASTDRRDLLGMFGLDCLRSRGGP
jgi:hypothetical protein